MAARYNALDMIMKYESGSRNVHQNIVPSGGGFNPSTGTVTGPSSASGYFQMINPTWRSAAGYAGIDTSQYPTAMSAPYDVQRQAANALFERDGFTPWAPYNANIRNEISRAGGANAFGSDRIIPSSSPLGSYAANNNVGSYSDFGGSGTGGYDAVQNPDGSYSFGSQTTSMSTLGLDGQGDKFSSFASPWETVGGNSPMATTPQTSTMGELGLDGGGGGISSIFGGSFSSFGTGSKGTLDGLLATLEKEKVKDIATETRYQTLQQGKAESEATKQEKSLYDKTIGTFTDYFARTAFVLTGIIILIAALFLFGRPVQRVITQNVRSILK